jgi:hypothetical protein
MSCLHCPGLLLLQVADGLYVSGEAVARDRSILAQHNITHVVNCVGALYPEYFKADGIQYKTLWLQGEPGKGGHCMRQAGGSLLLLAARELSRSELCMAVAWFNGWGWVRSPLCLGLLWYRACKS